jgi:hypothetical protein
MLCTEQQVLHLCLGHPQVLGTTIHSHTHNKKKMDPQQQQYLS